MLYDEEDHDKIFKRLKSGEPVEAIKPALYHSKNAFIVQDDIHTLMILLESTVDSSENKRNIQPLNPDVLFSTYNSLAKFLSRKRYSFIHIYFEQFESCFILLHGSEIHWYRLLVDFHLLMDKIM